MSLKSEPQKPNEYLTVGKVYTTHGVRGYLKVEPLTDYPERFEEIKHVYSRLPDGQLMELHIADVQIGPKQMLVKFKEFDQPEAAQVLRNCPLLIPRGEARKLPKGHYYYADMIGLEAVRSDTQAVVGRVEDILEAGQPLFLIRTPKGEEIMVPWVDAFLSKVDLPEGRLYLNPIPGLLEGE